MALAASIQITDQDLRTTTTALGGEYIGQVAGTADGRRFAYGQNGSTSTALSPGKLAQVATAVANHVNQTGTTQAAGDTTVSTWAVGATAVTADQYRGGYLVVNAGTGAGQAMLVRGNTKANSSGKPVLYLKDAFYTATSVSDSKFSLHPHPYSACIIQNATLGAGSAGVPIISIAASAAAFPTGTNGWFQTWGPCSVLSDAGAAAIGAPVTYSDDTNGAVGPYETDAVGAVLGWTMIAGVSTEYRPVFLTMDV